MIGLPDLFQACTQYFYDVLSFLGFDLKEMRETYWEKRMELSGSREYFPFRAAHKLEEA